MVILTVKLGLLLLVLYSTNIVAKVQKNGAVVKAFDSINHPYCIACFHYCGYCGHIACSCSIDAYTGKWAFCNCANDPTQTHDALKKICMNECGTDKDPFECTDKTRCRCDCGKTDDGDSNAASTLNGVRFLTAVAASGTLLHLVR